MDNAHLLRSQMAHERDMNVERKLDGRHGSGEDDLGVLWDIFGNHDLGESGFARARRRCPWARTGGQHLGEQRPERGSV
jgi:hypothetical protein